MTPATSGCRCSRHRTLMMRALSTPWGRGRRTRHRSPTETEESLCKEPPLPSATWEGVVNKMIGTFGAPIPEPSAQAILAYLKSHYTPETRKE